jgi:hypothetical protein
MIKSMVLADTTSRFPEEAGPQWLGRIKLAETEGMKAIAEHLLGRRFTAPFVKANPELMQKVGAAIEATPVGGFTACAHAVRQINVTERLGALTFPVLVMVGYTGHGGGLRGGGGVELDLSHPRHIDKLAIQYPDMKIISSRPAWPWQDEMIAIMLHKPNVWAEMHGWSPKYFTDPLKREIRNRFKERVMFGADYPLFQYERLVADWRGLGYDEAILDNVFHKTAEKLFGLTPEAA